MFCTQCRTEVPNTASFCPKCGAKIAASAPRTVAKPKAMPSMRVQPAATSAATATIAGASAAAAKTATVATAAMEGATKVASKTASAAAGAISKAKMLAQGANKSTIKGIASCILSLAGMGFAGAVIFLMLSQPCISVSLLGQQITIGSSNLFDLISGIANSGLVTADNAGNWANDIHWLFAQLPEDLRSSILVPCGWAVVWTITPIIIAWKAFFGTDGSVAGWLVFAAVVCLALGGYVNGIDILDIQITGSVNAILGAAIAGAAFLFIANRLEEN